MGSNSSTYIESCTGIQQGTRDQHNAAEMRRDRWYAIIHITILSYSAVFVGMQLAI